ncbi:MAG: TolC family protein [Phycisphaerales bacterium]|nr:MAG: TolC family protein [Phycisphaerales bacterium]
MFYRTIAALSALAFVAGCTASSPKRTTPRETLRDNLTTIDTVQLAEQSVSPPVSVEEATEQIAQQVTEPNAPSKTLELTLEQVRQATLANNLDLKVELVDPAIAQRSLDAERAKFESVFFGSASYARSEALGTGDVSKAWSSEVGVAKPLPTGGTLEIGLPFGDTDSGGLATAAASVSYVQSLLRGSGTRINTQSIRIAEHEWNIVSARTKRTAIALLANADIVYWRLYAARKALDVRREQYKLAQNQLSHAKKKVAAGSAPKIEIVLAEAGLASRLEAVINAETTVQSYRRELLRIMNRNDVPFEAAVDIVPKTNPSPLGLDLDVQQLAEKALTLRMEMIELEQLLRIDDLDIELARDATRPDLALTYRYSTQSEAGSVGSAFEDLTGNASDDHVIGLSASIPLGNRAAQARLQQARLVKIQNEAWRDRLRQTIRQEVYETVSDLERNWRRILATEQGVVAAFRDYRVKQSQFQLGASTSTDVLYSATQLADAQLSQIRAFSDYEIAQVNLARATGTLLGYGQVFLEPVDLPEQTGVSAVQ